MGSILNSQAKTKFKLMIGTVVENSHLLTHIEFDKLHPKEIQAWVIRNHFEEPIRQFNFGKAEKPSIEEIKNKFVKLYKESLEENKGYLKIGLCYALLATEKNYANGNPIYPKINRNINCNWSFEDLLKEMELYSHATQNQ